MQSELDVSLIAVTRRVETLLREGKPARAVRLERSFATTPRDLWDAVTNPERLPRWFLPVSGDLRPGGTYQFEGNAGGTITACDPPRHVAATWEFGGGVSWVELFVVPDRDALARLILSHIAPVDEHWQQYGAGAAGVGWDMGLLGLATHLATAGAGRFDGEALTTTAEGKAYIAALSERWRQAAVAGGEDPAEAATAARRTTEFYTGEQA